MLYWGESFTAGPIAETDLSGTLKAEYVYFGGKRIARRDLPSGAVHYYFSDHLNSTNLVYSASGTLEEDSDFYPYGGERGYALGSGNHFKFTGKERDPESGLDYFGARYYGNSLGRFLTPDWADSAAAVPYANYGDPQTLNLYTYSGNNPIEKVDSDGHEECFANGGCNPLKNAFDASNWVANGLLNTVSDLVSGDEVAKGTVDAVNAETTEGKVGTTIGLGLIVAVNVVTGGEGKAVEKGTEVAANTAEKALAGAVEHTAEKVGEGSGHVFGSKAHSTLEKEIKAANHPELHAEVSYKDGDVVKRGTKGSVRVDAVVGDEASPRAVHDLKTGKAKLTSRREAQIRKHLPNQGKGVEIKEARLK